MDAWGSLGTSYHLLRLLSIPQRPERSGTGALAEEWTEKREGGCLFPAHARPLGAGLSALVTVALWLSGPVEPRAGLVPAPMFHNSAAKLIYYPSKMCRQFYVQGN